MQERVLTLPSEVIDTRTSEKQQHSSSHHKYYGAQEIEPLIEQEEANETLTRYSIQSFETQSKDKTLENSVLQNSEITRTYFG